ncbi:hypothetical protein CHS0354_040009 [Potamilus streckersoni]|uniref:Uncharacterized protein n=1 Tax=Potamilus streckersoni TaxID=2493646 RepID=A0AAE0W0L8_9BIVA|nr:hypothetical protein CHS0354_040009 [Potamilus streckersoni]
MVGDFEIKEAKGILRMVVLVEIKDYFCLQELYEFRNKMTVNCEDNQKIEDLGPIQQLLGRVVVYCHKLNIPGGFFDAYLITASTIHHKIAIGIAGLPQALASLETDSTWARGQSVVCGPFRRFYMKVTSSGKANPEKARATTIAPHTVNECNCGHHIGLFYYTRGTLYSPVNIALDAETPDYELGSSNKVEGVTWVVLNAM